MLNSGTAAAACCWGNGSTGTTATVGASNNLIGSAFRWQWGATVSDNDFSSIPQFQRHSQQPSNAGVPGPAARGPVATVSSGNSLVNQNSNDFVGFFGGRYGPDQQQLRDQQPAGTARGALSPGAMVSPAPRASSVTSIIGSTTGSGRAPAVPWPQRQLLRRPQESDWTSRRLPQTGPSPGHQDGRRALTVPKPAMVGALAGDHRLRRRRGPPSTATT